MSPSPPSRCWTCTPPPSHCGGESLAWVGPISGDRFSRCLQHPLPSRTAGLPPHIHPTRPLSFGVLQGPPTRGVCVQLTLLRSGRWAGEVYVVASTRHKPEVHSESIRETGVPPRSPDGPQCREVFLPTAPSWLLAFLFPSCSRNSKFFHSVL